MEKTKKLSVCLRQIINNKCKTANSNGNISTRLSVSKHAVQSAGIKFVKFVTVETFRKGGKAKNIGRNCFETVLKCQYQYWRGIKKHC